MNSLLRDLQDIREMGYALDDEECEIGHKCVSVPLYDYSNQVSAAVSVFDSVDRLTDTYIQEEILPALKQLAQKISFRMGYSV